jgi:hypothetical protein
MDEIVGPVARVGGKGKSIRCFGWNPEGKTHLKDQILDGRIILKYIFNNSLFPF